MSETVPADIINMVEWKVRRLALRRLRLPAGTQAELVEQDLLRVLGEKPHASIAGLACELNRRGNFAGRGVVRAVLLAMQSGGLAVSERGRGWRLTPGAAAAVVQANPRPGQLSAQ